MNGLIAFLVVVALCAAVYLLGRSLFTHLRKVPDSFDHPEDRGDPQQGHRERQ